MPSATTSELDAELRFFEAHRTELVARAEGKYALVKGNELAGIFESQTEAIRAGYEKFGNQPFLVKQISVVDIPLNFTSFNLGI